MVAGRGEVLAHRQVLLDAAAVLQGHRTRVVRDLEIAGQLAGVTVVGHDEDLQEWMMRDARSWRSLLSVQSRSDPLLTRSALANNRRCLAQGLDMVSLWPSGTTDRETAARLAAEERGDYRFTVAPVQMKIIDRRRAFLAGPIVDGAPTVISVTRPEVLRAAASYWRAVEGVSQPVSSGVVGAPRLSERQIRVVALMQADHTDDSIANALGVSVRTVRSDIAAVLAELGVRSRFAAGILLASLDASA